MPAPTDADATAYLRAIDSQAAIDTDAVSAALLTEKRAQARKCRVPADDAAWPEDLAEALCRRVACNLAKRPHTLGFIPSVDPAGGTAHLSSNDPEIRRLEAPYRRVVFA